jgi:hypothetical protein
MGGHPRRFGKDRTWRERELARQERADAAHRAKKERRRLELDDIDLDELPDDEEG